MDPGDPRKKIIDCSTDPGDLRMRDWMSLFCDIVAVGECSGNPGDRRKKTSRPFRTRRPLSIARRGGARGQPQNRKQRCDASRGIRCNNATMEREEEEKDEARNHEAQNKGTSAVTGLPASLPGEVESAVFTLQRSSELSRGPIYVTVLFQAILTALLHPKGLPSTKSMSSYQSSCFIES